MIPEINIYIGTSLHGPTIKTGSYGYVLEFFKGETPITREGFSQIEKSTENQLTLEGLKVALSRVNTRCIINIFTENTYLDSAIKNNWLSKWQQEGWKSGKGQEIKNKKLWMELSEIFVRHHIVVRLEPNHQYAAWLYTAIKKYEERKNGKEYFTAQ